MFLPGRPPGTVEFVPLPFTPEPVSGPATLKIERPPLAIDVAADAIPDDAEQSFIDLIDAQMLEPPHPGTPSPALHSVAAVPSEPSAEDMAARFSAQQAIAASAESAELLAAHRAAQDAVLPAVAFPAIAPALPGNVTLRATVLPITHTVAEDHPNNWPPISGLDDMPTGQSLDESTAPPATQPHPLDHDATAAH